MENKNVTTTNTNPFVFFDIKFNDVTAGRVVIELFNDIVPKSAENFRCLCTGEKGIGKAGKPLHYKGSVFHKVVPLCMVQGGDIIKYDGTSGESIYGKHFEDENFAVKHDAEGMVGMMNSGPNSNHSQFYITTVPCTHLDGTNVVVGKVVKGLNIIIEMANISRENDCPTEKIFIENCGDFKPGESWNIQEKDGTADMYPPWPNDWDVDTKNFRAIKKAIMAIKDSGNHYYNVRNFVDSERKYIKTLRYIDWYLCHAQEQCENNIDELRLISMLNLAATKIKREKYKEALVLCNEVLLKDPQNVKAYYRRAQARLALKDYDKTLNDLNTAISMYPNDKRINDLLRMTKKHKLSYLKKERKAFSKLFTYV